MPIFNAALTLKDLPTPPPNKSGWPWDEQTAPMSERMLDGSQWPRISIVTPSYNQGQFIEETIRSILLQGYPNLEYIIIDGGSTDNSVEIIKKYEQYLAYWVSEADRGQSHALNKGLSRVTGQLIGWQNSDDYYQSKAFIHAAIAAQRWQSADVLHGTVELINADGSFISMGRVCEFDLKEMLWPGLINQATFIKDRIFKEGNLINESLQHAMDYDFFWRLALADYSFKLVPEIGASFRIHSQAKGSTQLSIFNKELWDLIKSLYNHKKLPLDVKKHALFHLSGFCLNDFGQLRLSLFRKHVRELAKMGGLSFLSMELIYKYFISFIGESNLKSLRKVRNFIRSSLNNLSQQYFHGENHS